MVKTKLKKHAVDAANALLVLFGFNVNTLKSEDLEKLPPAVSSAVRSLLPDGWLVAEHQQDVNDVRYLTIAAAERYTSLSRWSFYRAAARNELVVIKLGKSKSSKVLIDREEIDRFMKSRRCR